ncbi:DUF2892 domain-containing protein [Vannielia sp.]|uniref:YgaP family membrane protein n=1 Tax=Vannielia sp. TaxID=2813045 RepID=UPI0026373C9B|nr:DUF2892 domain-containing protein [Vannielia sp.]MDF1871560.1 DUF2892 domain-containing protein [Vannielia sp.]
MFKNNVGGIDRIVRIVVGAALIVAFFFYRDAAYGWLFLIGIIPLFTGLFGTCPLYSIFGMNSCPMKRN